MKINSSLVLSVALFTAMASAFSTTHAHAQDASTVTTTTTRSSTTNDYVTGPDTAMIDRGVVSLGLFYAVSVIIGIESPRSADNKLYIPVAGPWLDFADRGDCRGCRHETVYKILLAGDGVFQALGLLQIVGGLLSQQTHVVSTTIGAEPPAFALSPARLQSSDGRSSGYGLEASGHF